MRGEDYRLSLETVPTRWVQTAEMFLGLWRRGSEFLSVAFDALSDDFVALPTSRKLGEPLSLSPDGGRLLLSPPNYTRRRDGFGLLTLATGELHWYEARNAGEDRAGSLSPGGHLVATLTTSGDPEGTSDTDSGLVSIDVTNLHASDRKRLWSASGGWSAETAISWSPNGAAVAATYVTKEEEDATVVIGVNGAVVAHLVGSVILPSSNGTWIGDGELLCVDADFNLTVVDLDSGSHNKLARETRVPLAVIGDRLIKLSRERPNDDTPLVTTNLDGGDMRALLTIHPAQLVRPFDIRANCRLPAAESEQAAA